MPTNDHFIYDSIRGSGKSLSSNSTAAEINNSSGIVFASGSLVDSITNTSGVPYVAWCWKAGDSVVTNTAGAITSQVRANTTAGFSVVTYTGNGTISTVGHGLGAVPKLILVKKRNSVGGDNGWPVYHASLGGTKYLTLNLTDAEVANSFAWNNTNPTSSAFTVSTGGGVNTNTATYVAYCWTDIPGFSSFGSYTGNGNADGPFVNLGFRPALVIIKMTSSTGNWVMVDDKREGYNVDNDPLWANLTTVEANTDLLDLTSNGFKIRSTDASVNTNAGTYVYMAWAEFPSKYSLSR
jgi:hypothetical protein